MSGGLASSSGEEAVAQPLDADIHGEALTIEDLKASAGRGPRLEPSDIAKTYYSDEEFLVALEARRGRSDRTRAAGRTSVTARAKATALRRVRARLIAAPRGRTRPQGSWQRRRFS